MVIMMILVIMVAVLVGIGGEVALAGVKSSITRGWWWWWCSGGGVHLLGPPGAVPGLPDGAHSSTMQGSVH